MGEQCGLCRIRLNYRSNLPPFNLQDGALRYLLDYHVEWKVCVKLRSDRKWIISMYYTVSLFILLLRWTAPRVFVSRRDSSLCRVPNFSFRRVCSLRCKNEIPSKLEDISQHRRWQKEYYYHDQKEGLARNRTGVARTSILALRERRDQNRKW